MVGVLETEQVLRNNCLWAAIFVDLNRCRISYLRQTERKGFWATTDAGSEMAFNS